MRNPKHGGRREVHFGRGVVQGDRHSAWKNQLNLVFEIRCCLKKIRTGIELVHWKFGQRKARTRGIAQR